MRIKKQEVLYLVHHGQEYRGTVVSEEVFPDWVQVEITAVKTKRYERFLRRSLGLFSLMTRYWLIGNWR